MREKDEVSALVTLIREAQERGQPTLVGTTSIERSEAPESMPASRWKKFPIRC